MKHPTPSDGRIDAALEVIRGKEEGHNKVGGSTGALTPDQVSKLDNMLEILVQNATEEFGFFPRDVYCGVFDLPYSRAKHDPALVSGILSKFHSFSPYFSYFQFLNDFRP